MTAAVREAPASSFHATPPAAADRVPNPPPGTLKAARRRSRVPTILQMEATECGAASLAMILAAHRLWVPLEEMRASCGVSRDGSKAANLLRAARRYGLAAKGYQVEPAELHGSAFPLIAFWNFNHFVVLEGIDPKTGTAWINDPALGPRRVPADEFDSSFTGIVLSFEPVPSFRPGGAPPSVLRGLTSRLGRSGGLVALLGLISLGLIVPGLAAPILTQFFVDDILVPNLHDWFVPLLVGLGLTAVARGGLTALERTLILRLEVKLAVLEASRLFWHMFRAPVEFFSLRYIGDLSSRVGSVDRITHLLAAQAGSALSALTTVLLFGAVMLSYNASLALVSFVAVAGNALFLRLVWRRQDDTSRQLVREMGRLAGASVSTIASIETVKASGRETEAFGRWAGIQAGYLNAQQGSAQTAALLSVVPAVLQRLTEVAILGVGGLAVMRGDLTVGGLVAFQALAAGLATPVANLTGLGASVQAMKSELARLDDVLRHPVAPHLADTEAVLGTPAPSSATTATPGTPATRRLNGRLELRHITFGYSPLAAPLLDDVSLVLEPGARIALVGGSGSGKSTLGRVAAGLYRPWAGEVLLDGVRLDDIPHQVFAASVAYVDQSVFMFEGTVRDNLTLWDPTMEDAALVRALDDAGLLAVVESRPGRLDSPVLEFGTNFSGGQRQRMEIARALALDPALIVLDEATAALDPLVEEEIEGAMRRRGCASLVIAHRLSTVRDADEIIVLERGKIVQRGRHEELSAATGAYRDLMHAAEDAH